MTKLKIRQANLQDATAINEINGKSLGYPMSLEATEKILQQLVDSQREVILLAEEDQQVLGVLHGELYQTLYSPLLTNVLGLAVTQTDQGKGVGTALLRAFEKWSRQQGATGVRLNSGAERELAHEFYQKNGYRKVKMQANFKKEL